MASGNLSANAWQRVECCLRSRSDRDLLTHILDAEQMSFAALEPTEPFSDAADLLIVDLAALQHRRDHILRLRSQAHPAVLPVLLLVPNQHASTQLIKNDLGTTLEDVLRLPTTALEIRARTRNLLRLRALSLRQYHENAAIQQAFEGLSRAYKTLNACNEVMLRESSTDGLIRAVCRVITRSEGYDLAWVGFVADDTATDSSVVISEAFGTAQGYVDDLVTALDYALEVNSAVGAALSTGQTQVMTDLASNSLTPNSRAWGLKGVMILPLPVQYGPKCVLAVYSRHYGDFAQEEAEFLQRLGDNLAHGLDMQYMKREREQKDLEIKRLAYHDALTSLPNRHFLLQHLEQLTRPEITQQSAAVLFIDLNDFKVINDGLGHAAGDQVLKLVAQRIEQTLRDGDLVGRQGGDEFIVVMIDRPRQASADEPEGAQKLLLGAESLAGRIQESLRQPIEIQGHTHHLSASIGVSFFPLLASDVATVVDQADMAMYHAKKTGLPLVFYSHDLGSTRQKRMSLEADLYHALTTEQFILHYQPIWEIDGGKIVGVEALLRWKNSHGEMVSPGVFIPLAEEIGLIGALGDWVLVTAARQLALWRQSGVDIWMSVNLSVSQLNGRKSAVHIRDLLIAEGTLPEWWSLELTEDALMQSPEGVAEAMHWLNQEGFHLSLDDFGQGYSSLARLQLMPLDTLKIDKMFIDHMEVSVAGNPVVNAIIEIARHLKLKTVAEGIETEKQKLLLGEIGCQYGQGFLFSAARPAEDIPNLVEASLWVEPTGAALRQ